jgi:hypothetical protein
MFDQFLERLLRLATAAGGHAVVLGATADPATGMLLHRLDRTSARLAPPSSRPWGTPAG